MSTFAQLQVSNKNSIRAIYNVEKWLEIVIWRKCILGATKTIRLSALDFHEGIVDEAEGRISYHLMSKNVEAHSVIVK